MDDPIQGFFYRDFANAHIPEILHEIYIDKVYEPFLKDKKGLFIVDIGANIGMTANYFKDFAREVWAVEPARAHIECISKLIKYNDIQNIRIQPYAISGTTGPSFLYHHTNSTMNGLDARLNTKGEVEIVMALSIDVLIDMFGISHIDFMKLDPEGAESDIILSEGFKKNVEKIPLIVGEWHKWTKLSQDDFKKQFETLGYAFEWIPKQNAAIYTARRL